MVIRKLEKFEPLTRGHIRAVTARERAAGQGIIKKLLCQLQGVLAPRSNPTPPLPAGHTHMRNRMPRLPQGRAD